MKKSYRFPKQKKITQALQSFSPKVSEREAEVLTHQVNGIKASDLEERFARALGKTPATFEFQFVHRYVNGAPEAVDFLVNLFGRWFGVQVDDTTFIHKSSKAHDALVDIDTITDLKKYGCNPLNPEIIHLTDFDLSDQKSADRIAAFYFG